VQLFVDVPPDFGFRRGSEAENTPFLARNHASL
jgi:hypothetical protein